MNELREETLALISRFRTARPAVLRRSLREDALYATDLPQAADAEAADAFCRMAEEAGWKAETDKGWILLDRIPEEPPRNGFQGPYGPRAKCCASLLKRHHGEHGPDGERERRMLLKAGEEGAEASEKACSRLHREWAEALREDKGLPRIRIEFFNGGKEK